MDTAQERLIESMAVLMIGDGALGLMYPRDHCRLWMNGPVWWRDCVGWFAEHPALTRALAATEIAAGLCLARRQELRPSESVTPVS